PKNPLVEALLRLPVFGQADVALLDRIATRLEPADFVPGALVLKAGAPAESLSFVLEGKASVFVVQASTGATAPFQSLRPNEYIGELSILTGGANPFTVLADDKMRVITMRADAVKWLLPQMPAFADALAKTLAQRMQRMLSIQFGSLGSSGAASTPEA